jgi:hypothetical protein
MLRQQLQALHTAAADGLPVRMVELGNELYQSGYIGTGPNGHDYARRFPTAADYAAQMNAWISAIHGTFPRVRIAAVAADANDVNGLAQRRRTWNADVLPVLNGEDAVSIHENLRVFDASSSAATVLALPYLHFQRLKAHELARFQSDRLPVWVTEFNLADLTKGRVFRGTWLHGLFVAAEALLFTGDPHITYAGLNDTVGAAESAPIFNGSQGFGSRGPKTVPLALSAAGTTLATMTKVTGPGSTSTSSSAGAGSLRQAPRARRRAGQWPSSADRLRARSAGCGAQPTVTSAAEAGTSSADRIGSGSVS